MSSACAHRSVCVALIAMFAVACASNAPPREATSARAPPGDARMSEDAPTNGGNAPPAAPSGTTEAVPGTQDGDPTSPRPMPPPPPTHAPSTMPVPGTTSRPQSPDVQRSWALATLGDSERQIEATVKECATACRALASMERAAKTLCDLGERDECTRAKARVEAARDKVRKSCGKCENGPSLTPGAPIRSTP